MRGPDDAAISDVLGTLLLVLVVVLAGSGLSLVVASNLRTPETPAAALALSPARPGDTTMVLSHRAGDPLAIPDLSIKLARGTDPAVAIPSTAWVLSSPGAWQVGGTLALPLSPPAVAGERFTVSIFLIEGNAQLASLSTTAPGSVSPLPTPAINATLSPSSMVADSATATLLAVRVSHPLGALGVASVRANLTHLAAASQSANASLSLSDGGSDGDAFGGDGVWSGLIRAPLNTTPGNYTIPVTVRDIAGFDAATTNVTLHITANLSSLVGGGGNGTMDAAAVAALTAALANLSTLGNLTHLLANLSGGTPGVIVLNSTAAGEGTRLVAPTSQNLSSFHLTNFSWDRSAPDELYMDAAVIRILSAGYAWSAYMRFGYISSVPSMTRIEMWSSNSTAGRTVYLPSNGANVPLAGLSLNMTDPAQSGFVCSLRCTPQMTYKNSDLRGSPVLIVAYMRDEGNNPDTSQLGLYSLEAVLR